MSKGMMAAAFVAATAVTGAQAATIDFTDISVWVDGSSTQIVNGAEVSLTSTGGSVRQILKGAPGAVGGILGESDGLGIADDEITAGTRESITVNFSKAVTVVGLHFLDIFKSLGVDLESAIATFSDGTVVESFATELNTGAFGYAFNGAFAPITTTSITFTVGAGNDDRGFGDFALAGIDLAPIPLPAAGWTFLSAMIGMGLLARRRTA